MKETVLTEILPNSPNPDARMTDGFSSAFTVFGHPPGLWVLVLTETFLSFSLYGMQSLLVLYLASSLLLPGHVEQVWGIKALQSFLKIIYDPQSTKAMAGAITGLYLALVYAVPIIGGILSDRFFGRTRMIIAGSILMTVGHFMMSFERSFVLAILCLLMGLGATASLKAQVGALYALEDRRRSDAYQFFSLGVQFAVILAPIVCGLLAKISWHWGFAAASMGMLVGLCIYLTGRRWLPAEPAMHELRAKRPPLTVREKKTTFLLLALLPVMGLGAVINDEIFDGYLLWGQDHYQLTILGFALPVSSLLSIDAFFGVVTSVAVLWFWRVYSVRRPEPPEVTKVAIGYGISVCAPIFLMIPSLLYPGPHQISLVWGLLFHLVNDIGFTMSYVIGMAMYSRAAPASLNTILVASFSLHLFLSNLIVGKFSTLLGRISDSLFWGLHSALGLVAAVIVGLCAVFFRDLLAPEASGK